MCPAWCCVNPNLKCLRHYFHRRPTLRIWRILLMGIAVTVLARAISSTWSLGTSTRHGLHTARISWKSWETEKARVGISAITMYILQLPSNSSVSATRHDSFNRTRQDVTGCEQHSEQFLVTFSSVWCQCSGITLSIRQVGYVTRFSSMRRNRPRRRHLFEGSQIVLQVNIAYARERISLSYWKILPKKADFDLSFQSPKTQLSQGGSLDLNR